MKFYVQQFESGSKKRITDSLVTFRKALFPLTDDTAIADIKMNDALLHFLPDSREWHEKVGDNPATLREKYLFGQSPYIQQLLIDVSNRLGFKRTLSLDDVEQMYKICGYETADDPQSKPAFCAAFTPSQSKSLEYLFYDLYSYYQLGYGSLFNMEIYNPIIAYMITKLTRAANGESGTERGAFYFTHTEMMLPTLLKLGLYRDNEPLRHDNFETMYADRQWFASRVSPSTSNIIAVLYKCPDENEFKVALYHNEFLIKHPYSPDGINALSILQEKFKNEVEEIEDD